jgi:lysozyme
MTRAAIFAAFRAAKPGLFNDPAWIGIVDGICDDAGIARESAPGGLVPSQACADMIAKWEGMEKKLPDGRFKAYPDPGTGGDPWTIGVGTTGPDVKPGTIWTREQCLERFRADLDKFAKGVAKALDGAPTTQSQFDAMVSLAYNIGLGAFGKSTLLKRHKAGDHGGAAAQFSKWVNAGGKPMQGLRNRRWDETRLYEGKA